MTLSLAYGGYQINKYLINAVGTQIITIFMSE
jgi:hypothetical protein